MCSIMAANGKLSSNRIKALLSLGEERGTDSVGIGYMKDGEMQIAKVAERPCVAVNLTLNKSITEAAISGLMIGHTRQATQGKVNSRNAHPFFMDGIAFAHNGIILNDDDFGQYEVDSESLIHGIKGKDFSKYKGPIALVWIENGTLKAFRCGNPLYRGRHNGSTYLASEADYLEDIGCTHVKALSEGMIYTFDKGSFGVTTERIPKNTVYEAITSYTSHGWEESLRRSYIPPAWNSKGKTESIYEPRPLEDFRTVSDISKALTVQQVVSSCECCGEMAELSESKMCLSCITWLDNQGIDRDSPPAWMGIR